MTVSELRTTLEKIESIGKGSLPVVRLNDGTTTLLVVLVAGTTEAWPDASRLIGREYRGAGQDPDRSAAPVEVVLIQ